MCAPMRDTPKLKIRKVWNIRKGKNDNISCNQNKAGVAMCLLYNVDFKVKMSLK